MIYPDKPTSYPPEYLVTCGYCDGTGREDGSDDGLCRTCGGLGYEDTRPLKPGDFGYTKQASYGRPEES
jgi:DnaJ-class molecular chaperone